jgi:tyrosyl-tRNA synthetase
MLYGLDGRKMATSWGNVINITDSYQNMFGKIMSMKDELIIHYFELTSKKEQKEIKRIDKLIKSGKLNPRNAKIELAKEIVALYYNKETAEKAEIEFEQIFQRKKAPQRIRVFKATKKEYLILELIFKTGLTNSKNQAKRLVLEKGVKINGKIVSDWKKNIKIVNGMILQIGKRHFVKIKI